MPTQKITQAARICLIAFVFVLGRNSAGAMDVVRERALYELRMHSLSDEVDVVRTVKDLKGPVRW